MNPVTQKMLNLPREQWIAALNQLPSNTFEAILSSLPEAWQYRPKSLPQAGLALLKMCESTQALEFYLGEFPLASVVMIITVDDGLEYEGAALVMDDDLNRAEAMAICDCIMANQLTGWQDVAKLIELGDQKIQQTQKNRKHILQRTRVDFSLLEDAGENNA